MRGNRSNPSPLVLLTELARDARNQLPVPTPAELGTKWAVVSTRIAAQKARRRTLVRLSMAGVVATAVVAAWTLPRLGLIWRVTAQAALSYTVEGGTVVDGGYFRESGSDTVKMRFTEGTEFVLIPGTRARLRTVTARAHASPSSMAPHPSRSHREARRGGKSTSGHSLSR